MKFLDNTTDRMILDYVTKSMNSEDIEKSLNRSGLVQVERTVSKPGITPFRQKFWVRPDEVRKTDIVLHGQPKNNIAVNAIDTGNTWKPIAISGNWNISNLITSDTKVSPNVELDKGFNKRMNQTFDVLQNQISTLSNIDVHLKEVNRRFATMQFSLSDESVQSELKEFLSKFTTKEKPKVMTVNGKIVVEAMVDTKAMLQTYREEHIQSFLESFIQRKLAPLKSQVDSLTDNQLEHLVSRNAKSARENELFGDTLKQLTSQQLRDFRVTGMGADANDKHAVSYIRRMSDNFRTGNLRKQFLNNTGGQYDYIFDRLDSIPLKQLKSTLQQYQSNPPFDVSFGIPDCIKDNELKTKIRTASYREFKEVSNHIAKTWNNANMKYRIKCVLAVDNMAIDDDFNAIVSKNRQYKRKDPGGKNCQLDSFYHGTDPVSTVLILGHSGQFKVPKVAKAGRSFGNGVYLAENSSKSAPYLGEQYVTSNFTGTLMLCEASLGKSHWEDGSTDHDRLIQIQNTYDSIGVAPTKLTRLRSKEYVVFNEKAVRPKYLVELELL